MYKNRNYLLLLAAQTLGAFGDQFILAVIIGQFTFLRRDGAITQAEFQMANAVYPSLLFVPFVLLGPVTGYLNDRFPKNRWLLGGNAIKLLGCLLAALSLGWGHGGLHWQGVGYFIVGIGACFYGPAKYGILPEILPRERLVKANGTVEMLTLAAILFGALGGAKMIDHFSPFVCYGVLMAIYGMALALNSRMDVTPNNPNVDWRQSVPEFFSHYFGMLRQPRLGRVLVGTAVFWICGAVLKMNFNPWGLGTLGYSKSANPNTAVALLGLWLAVGVMAGSMLAGHLHKVGDIRATQPYGWLLAGIIAAMSLVSQHVLVVPTLICCGVFAGLFLIPLNAALQAESDPSKLGKTIACQNFQENVAMSVSGVLVTIAANQGFTPQAVFLGLAAVVAMSVVALRIPVLAEPPSKPTPAS